MSLQSELAGINSIFLDTAPIIYYIEAHPQYGPLMKDIVDSFKTGILEAYTSVITITEVLPKLVYDSLRTMDALQLSAAIKADVDIFITNDIKLKQVNEVKVLVLNDYVTG